MFGTTMACKDSVNMLPDILHMNSGDEEFSYANNSTVQVLSLSIEIEKFYIELKPSIVIVHLYKIKIKPVIWTITIYERVKLFFFFLLSISL